MLVFVYFLAAAYGVLQAIAPSNDGVQILFSLLFASAVTQATLEDGSIRRKEIIRILQVVYFFTWPIASAVYLGWTRGWKGLVPWAFLVVSFFAAGVAVFLPTHALLAWLGWIDPYSLP